MEKHKGNTIEFGKTLELIWKMSQKMSAEEFVAFFNTPTPSVSQLKPEYLEMLKGGVNPYASWKVKTFFSDFYTCFQKIFSEPQESANKEVSGIRR